MVTLALAALVVLFVPLAVYGAMERRPVLLGVSAVLAIPVAWFVGAFPPFPFLAWFLPVVLVLAAMIVRARPRLAQILAFSCAVSVLVLLVGWAVS